jgi:hypothetical protein
MPLSRIGLSQNQQVTGNVTFTGTGNRITGDFSNATAANRVWYQTSTANATTIFDVVPNGTGVAARGHFYNSSDPANASLLQVGIQPGGANALINSTIAGTGTYLPITMFTGGSERLRIDTSGNVGIGTSSPPNKFTVWDGGTLPSAISNIQAIIGRTDGFANAGLAILANASNDSRLMFGSNSSPTLGGIEYGNTTNAMRFSTNSTERMRIDDSGNLLVGKTAAEATTEGQTIYSGAIVSVRSANALGFFNRLTNDGDLIAFRQDSVTEGTISVSGTAVSYNGGHLSRWSQLPDGSKDDTILKGTVLTNLDDMCVWEKDGVVAENEQLNKMKVSDVEGDTNVAGVFVNWTIDADYGVDDMNVAMTGDMIIRIAEGVVVQKGDLLMSAGDGTAKPQGDDIVRSKTIAKVTSNHVTCTYADGSYCVPCVLMAC